MSSLCCGASELPQGSRAWRQDTAGIWGERFVWQECWGASTPACPGTLPQVSVTASMSHLWGSPSLGPWDVSAVTHLPLSGHVLGLTASFWLMPLCLTHFHHNSLILTFFGAKYMLVSFLKSFLE